MVSMVDGEIRDETGTQRLVGYVIDLSDPGGQARVYLDLDDRHLNRHGVLHGGIAAMLLDSASGFTCSLTEDRETAPPVLTVSLNTNFLAPGKPGRVTAVGKVIGGGRSLKYANAKLTHEDGTLIATSTGVFKRVRGGKP